MKVLSAVLAGAVLGAAAGALAVSAVDERHRASVTLQTLPSTAAPLVEGRRLLLATQSETYAQLLAQRAFLEQIRPQVAGGGLSIEELIERVDAERPQGTALVQITADAPTEAEARGLASDVAGALVGYVQQTARQRAAQAEDELRRRIDDLSTRILQTTDEPARLEALREERAELNAALARLAGDAVAEGTRLAIAGAPALEPEPLRPSRLAWGTAGAAIGALLALLAAVLAPRRARARRPAVVREAELQPGPAPAPAAEPEREPVLLEPLPNAILTGPAAVRVEPAETRVEWSPDGTSWTALEGAEWATATVPDGAYLLRVAGSAASITVFVDNTPPAVALVAPDEARGTVVLRADASDAGSGVASTEFMLSTGTAEWTTIAAGPEAEWDTTSLPAGIYWICAVARDRAGLPAASEPQAVRVTS